MKTHSSSKMLIVNGGHIGKKSKEDMQTNEVKPLMPLGIESAKKKSKNVIGKNEVQPMMYNSFSDDDEFIMPEEEEFIDTNEEDEIIEGEEDEFIDEDYDE